MTPSDASPEPWILLTNDDGVDSPVVPPLLRELSKVSLVRAVMPASECSWTGKVMSRFGVLEPLLHRCGGHEVWAVDGYPADCANLGVYSLFETPPALVVSGVNMGTNAGLAFLLSSGTVGAAVEAMLAGVPAVAFSLQLESADYRRWRQQRNLGGDALMLLEHCALVTREIVSEILHGGLPGDASLLAVNMPSTVRPDSPRRLAPLSITSYGAYFVRDARGCFTYSLSGLRLRFPAPGGDLETVAGGAVALTPIRFALDAEVSPAERARFERPPRGGGGAGEAQTER